MPQYDNSNSGALFTNKTATSDKHPNLTGQLQLSREHVAKLAKDCNEGRDPIIRLAAWTKRNDDGSLKVLSLKASEWEHRNSGDRVPGASGSGNFDPNEPVPF
mgnify:CR=1 FL=1